MKSMYAKQTKEIWTQDETLNLGQMLRLIIQFAQIIWPQLNKKDHKTFEEFVLNNS